MLNLHMICVAKMTRLFGEQMAQRGKGYILNMSSMSAWMAMPGIQTYNATKAFIYNLSKSLWYEFKPLGVHIRTERFLAQSGCQTHGKHTTGKTGENSPEKTVPRQEIIDTGGNQLPNRSSAQTYARLAGVPRHQVCRQISEITIRHI